MLLLLLLAFLLLLFLLLLLLLLCGEQAERGRFTLALAHFYKFMPLLVPLEVFLQLLQQKQRGKQCGGVGAAAG